MKTEEDEAFDDLAKKQGDWGGGFKAKRAMAKARVEEDDDIQDYRREWVGLTGEDFSAIKFPAEMRFPAEFRAGARWAEDKLKEKNNAEYRTPANAGMGITAQARGL